MWSADALSCRTPLLLLLIVLAEFREIALLFMNEGHWSSVHGAPVTPKSGIDPLSYLRNYGYLPKSSSGAQELQGMEEFQSAVRRFQRMIGVNETGRMDPLTISMMSKPRCGRPDVAAPQEFTAGLNRWEKWDLTYRLLSYTRDLDTGSVVKAIEDAFSLWSSVTPLNFRRVDRDQADLMVSFDTLDHSDGYPFDGPGGVLAHAFPPGDGSGGDIHFDDDERWTKYSTEGTNLYIVATHEIGHSLGLLHSQDHSALMFPVYQGYQRNFRLGSDDTRGIQSIYGSRARPVTARPRPPTTPSPSPRGRTDDAIPQLCSAHPLDAVASIRGEIFVFHRKWFWRLRRDDNRPAAAQLIASFWTGLPKTIDRIDAVFENPTNGRIFFFSGNNYWELKSNQLADRFPTVGRRLQLLGLPAGVTGVDAAFALDRSRSAYVLSGDAYWKVDTTTGRRAQKEQLSGLMGDAGSIRPDAAFTNFDNRTYFIKGSKFWRLKENAMQVEKVSSQKTPHLWPQCRSEEISSASRSSTQIIYYAFLFIFLYKYL